RPPAAPTVTPVIVPPLFVSVSTSTAHAHAAPFHLSIWFMPHDVGRPSVTAPLVPPPTRPAPAVTAVMSPVSASAPHPQREPVDGDLQPELLAVEDLGVERVLRAELDIDHAVFRRHRMALVPHRVAVDVRIEQRERRGVLALERRLALLVDDPRRERDGRRHR